MVFVKVQNGLDRVQAGQVAVIRDRGLEQNCCFVPRRRPLLKAHPAALHNEALRLWVI
jgi:hypothetical protein